MNKFIYYFLLLYLSSGCISVSVQQRQVVNQFASKTENFASFPEKLLTELADIREARGIYYANSFTDTDTHLNELNAIFNERMNDNKIPGKVKLVFSILDEYAKAFVLLSSDAPFYTQSDLYGRFGVNLESLTAQYNRIDGVNPIPTGVGNLLSESLDFGTRTYLLSQQYKALRKYVSQADTLVSILCDEMVSFLSSKGMGKIIDNEETGVTESFRFYFTKRSPPAIESEKEYIHLMERVEIVKQLQMQTIRAAKNLKIAHKKLTDVMTKKKSLKEIAEDLNNFYKDEEQIRKLLLKIDKK